MRAVMKTKLLLILLLLGVGVPAKADNPTFEEAYEKLAYYVDFEVFFTVDSNPNNRNDKFYNNGRRDGFSLKSRGCKPFDHYLCPEIALYHLHLSTAMIPTHRERVNKLWGLNFKFL